MAAHTQPPPHTPPHPLCQGLDQQLSALSTQDNSGRAAEQQRARRAYEEKVGGGGGGGGRLCVEGLEASLASWGVPKPPNLQPQTLTSCSAEQAYAWPCAAQHGHVYGCVLSRRVCGSYALARRVCGSYALASRAHSVTDPRSMCMCVACQVSAGEAEMQACQEKLEVVKKQLE